MDGGTGGRLGLRCRGDFFLLFPSDILERKKEFHVDSFSPKDYPFSFWHMNTCVGTLSQD